MEHVYSYLSQHDEVLDAVEESIITVNLPGRQSVYVICQEDADLLLAVKSQENESMERQESIHQLDQQYRFW
ncbi:hypothetical protein [Candidatus Pantoea bituminis]|uniref:hypothetical protein n=1 Tax=Candidatus Pantoea bituminis TaxID=2831036 RepID=UPI001C06255C|nr:hypothetical protein [Pantoea bituminis]